MEISDGGRAAAFSPRNPDLSMRGHDRISHP
jgi:hypothetical protein